jgi:hypothetical protein
MAKLAKLAAKIGSSEARRFSGTRLSRLVPYEKKERREPEDSCRRDSRLRAYRAVSRGYFCWMMTWTRRFLARLASVELGTSGLSAP